MHGDNDRRIGRIRILKRLLSLRFFFFLNSLHFFLALSYKDIYCPCDVCKQTLTLRHSVRTELSRCLTMSLLLASVNRMKSNCPPTHTLSNAPSLFDAHGPLGVQTDRDRALFRTH